MTRFVLHRTYSCLGNSLNNEMILTSAFEMLQIFYSKMELEDIKKFLISNFGELLEDPKLCERVIIEAIYESALRSDMAEIKEIQKEEALKIPTCIDYGSEKLNLSTEEKEKLEMARPQTIAAASRIPGVTPTSLIRLMKYLKSSSTARETLTN